jgi:hypothetical protein
MVLPRLVCFSSPNVSPGCNREPHSNRVVSNSTLSSEPPATSTAFWMSARSKESCNSSSGSGSGSGSWSDPSPLAEEPSLRRWAAKHASSSVAGMPSAVKPATENSERSRLPLVPSASSSGVLAISLPCRQLPKPNPGRNNWFQTLHLGRHIACRPSRQRFK